MSQFSYQQKLGDALAQAIRVALASSAQRMTEPFRVGVRMIPPAYSDMHEHLRSFTPEDFLILYNKRNAIMAQIKLVEEALSQRHGDSVEIYAEMDSGMGQGDDVCLLSFDPERVTSPETRYAATMVVQHFENHILDPGHRPAGIFLSGYGFIPDIPDFQSFFEWVNPKLGDEAVPVTRPVIYDRFDEKTILQDIQKPSFEI